MRAELQRLKRDTDSERSYGSTGAANEAPAVIVAAPASGAGLATASTASSSTAQAVQPAHVSGVSSSVATVVREHRLGLATIAIVVRILVAAAGYGIYSFWNSAGTAPFQNFSITQVTNTGKAKLAAISPDGKYILRVENDNGKEALWLRNVPTNSDARIIEPSVATYSHLAFSPDGNYLYFLEAADKTENNHNLYRAPVLGGEPRQIGRDIDSDIAFSPDGNRIAYFRGNDPIFGESRLLSANPDGTDENVLLVQPNTALPPLWLSWSPDAKQIAYAFRQVQVGSKGLSDCLISRVGRAGHWRRSRTRGCTKCIGCQTGEVWQRLTAPSPRSERDRSDLSPIPAGYSVPSRETQTATKRLRSRRMAGWRQRCK